MTRHRRIIGHSDPAGERGWWLDRAIEAVVKVEVEGLYGVLMLVVVMVVVVVVVVVNPDDCFVSCLWLGCDSCGSGGFDGNC